MLVYGIPSTLLLICALGESHSALICLYRAVELPSKEDLDKEEKLLA